MKIKNVKMDISEKYIEMCSKATEIQELRVKKDQIDEQSFFSWVSDGSGGYRPDIWLPRQDQLQEIVKEYLIKKQEENLEFNADFDINVKHDISLLFYFSEFISRNYDDGEDEYNNLTINQFWLLFLMLKKYNKTWDEEKQDWVIM